LPQYPSTRPAARFEYAISIAVVGICTAIALPGRSKLALTNFAIVYLLGVLAVSVRCRRGPAILNAVLSVLACYYFFVPPFNSFRIDEYSYIVTLVGLLIVALVTSTQTVKIRTQAAQALQREERTKALYLLSRELSNETGVVEAARSAVEIMSGLFDAKIRVFLPDDSRVMDLCVGVSGIENLSPEERKRVQTVLDAGQKSIRADGLDLPLICSGVAVAVMSVIPQQPRLVQGDELDFLEICCNQIATAIERMRNAAAARNAEIEIQTERTRTALLSAVSHDLKTPLSSIYGSATTLIEEESRLKNEERRELLASIAEETERMNRLITNLLEMTRLESGLHAAKDWYPFEEIIGAALTRLENTLRGRPITTDIPPDLPLVFVDAVLLEQVFVNLLDNAVKYTPPGTPIGIAAAENEGNVTIAVSDRGPGFNRGDEGHVFEKFFRGKNQGVRGAGLGLAICRAIVEGHGGRISAENEGGGGAVIRLQLPVGGTPPDIELASDSHLT
jgi:two-component system sensor histidine kinase KdpD